MKLNLRKYFLEEDHQQVEKELKCFHLLADKAIEKDAASKKVESRKLWQDAFKSLRAINQMADRKRNHDELMNVIKKLGDKGVHAVLQKRRVSIK